VYNLVVDEDGRPRELKLVDGRYFAIYVRVSTEGQVDDGYSIEDQIRRGIAYALQKGWAFRIFSDASLSGGLPINRASLIRDLAAIKAQRL
jgi:DNA invertase Pin-like site-specific DNA recombinase